MKTLSALYPLLIMLPYLVLTALVVRAYDLYGTDHEQAEASVARIQVAGYSGF